MKIRFGCIIIFVIAVFFSLPVDGSATTWLELSDKLSSDNNVYTFYTPYYDAYQNWDFKFNHKDKLRSATHYSLNYNANLSYYRHLIDKNTYSHNFTGSLEEDLNDSLVAILSSKLNLLNYATSAYSKYNYSLFDIAASLRFYIFALDFTCLEWGLNYSNYNLPNYNFEKELFTPSLNFLEEVVEYHGFGTFVSIKQALRSTTDLEFEGRITTKTSPERPLYRSITSITPIFQEEKRRDLDSTLSLALIHRYLKSSYIKLIGNIGQTNSNANAAVRDGSSGAVHLEDDYYNLLTSCVALDTMYCFGKENSFVWFNCSLKQKNFPNRPTQNYLGALQIEKRSDKELSLSVEFDQRLGLLWGSGWTLKTGYTYIQNVTNDYFYKYNREIIYLGLSAYLYL